MSDRRTRTAPAPRALLAAAALATFASCFAGRSVERTPTLRNGGPLSAELARPQAGGRNEGPMGFAAPTSHSYLWGDLARQGVRVEQLGRIRDITDRRQLLAVMNSFSRALGVQCTWCHVENNFAAATPRKAVTNYMWERFVHQMRLADGEPLYCDSCHHGTTIFLDRRLETKPTLLRWMQTEYVDQLARRDDGTMGCATCHGHPFNARFLPRMSTDGVHQPPAAPGPQP